MQKIFYSWFQDNMIDEEKAKKEAAGQMTFEQKINLLNDQVSELYFSWLKIVFPLIENCIYLDLKVYMSNCKILFFWTEDQSSQ